MKILVIGDTHGKLNKERDIFLLVIKSLIECCESKGGFVEFIKKADNREFCLYERNVVRNLLFVYLLLNHIFPMLLVIYPNKKEFYNFS